MINCSPAERHNLRKALMTATVIGEATVSVYNLRSSWVT